MIPTTRVWSDAQLRAAEMYIQLYAVPIPQLSASSVDGARMGEHQGVRFLRWDHGPLEVLADDTGDDAMTALLEAYNNASEDDFPPF